MSAVYRYGNRRRCPHGGPSIFGGVLILERLEASTCVSRFLLATPQVGERTEFVQDSRRELVLPAAIRLIRLAGSRLHVQRLRETPKTALVRLRPVPSYYATNCSWFMHVKLRPSIQLRRLDNFTLQQYSLSRYKVKERRKNAYLRIDLIHLILNFRFCVV